MRRHIDAAVAGVEARWRAGTLIWNYETVQSLITPYPKRGRLDELKIGQEDEATPDPDGVPWDVEDAAALPPNNANDDDTDSESWRCFAESRQD